MNHVINLKKQYDKVAILDMDIANPYFRSRERQEFLEDMGITIHFNSFGYDITEDLPAISACMKAPLENKDYMVVADVGGDNAGARVLNQFKKYFVDESDCEMLIVVNANRPETDTLEGALYHIQTIQAETGLKVKGLRYGASGYTEQYLKGGEVTVAYSPEDTGRVWLLENGNYHPFDLIESRFRGKDFSQAESLKTECGEMIRDACKENQQAKIDLAGHIESIARRAKKTEDTRIKDIRKTRQREQRKRHVDVVKEGVGNV